MTNATQSNSSMCFTAPESPWHAAFFKLPMVKWWSHFDFNLSDQMFQVLQLNLKTLSGDNASSQGTMSAQSEETGAKAEWLSATIACGCQSCPLYTLNFWNPFKTAVELKLFVWKILNIFAWCKFSISIPVSKFSQLGLAGGWVDEALFGGIPFQNGLLVLRGWDMTAGKENPLSCGFRSWLDKMIICCC